jgi:hypothetical protein
MQGNDHVFHMDTLRNEDKIPPRSRSWALLLQNALTFVEVIRIIRGTLMRDA